jgi:hypothetical protein
MPGLAGPRRRWVIPAVLVALIVVVLVAAALK